MKKDCSKWKREKGKEKKQDTSKPKESSMKIEEVNSVFVGDSDGDICYTSAIGSSLLVAKDEGALQDWLLDSGASFHVTPHRGVV